MIEHRQDLLKLIAWCWVNNPQWILEAMDIAFKLKAKSQQEVH